MEVRVILSKDAETNTYFDSLMRESAQDSICVLDRHDEALWPEGHLP